MNKRCENESELRRRLWKLILSWRKNEDVLRESAGHTRADGTTVLEKIVRVRSHAKADMLSKCADQIEELLEGDR